MMPALCLLLQHVRWPACGMHTIVVALKQHCPQNEFTCMVPRASGLQHACDVRESRRKRGAEYFIERNVWPSGDV